MRRQHRPCGPSCPSHYLQLSHSRPASPATQRLPSSGPLPLLGAQRLALGLGVEVVDLLGGEGHRVDRLAVALVVVVLHPADHVDVAALVPGTAAAFSACLPHRVHRIAVASSPRLTSPLRPLPVFVLLIAVSVALAMGPSRPGTETRRTAEARCALRCSTRTKAMMELLIQRSRQPLHRSWAPKENCAFSLGLACSRPWGAAGGGGGCLGGRRQPNR